jgi:DNA-binding cell septation regulator SpoVG
MVIFKEDITDVRFKDIRSKKKRNNNCDICSVTIAGAFVIHGVKVRRRNGRYEVALPERRVGVNDESKPVITYLSLEFKDALTEVVLNKYFSLIDNK